MHAAQQTETFAFPGGHDDEHHQRQHQRQPTAGEQFQGVGGEHRHVDNQQDNQNANGEETVPVPILDRHRGHQNTGQHHGTGNGDTVSRRQVAGVFKAHNDQHYRDIQRPVNHRNIDLARFHFRGMDNAHRRQIAQAHRLAGQGEHAGNHRLRGDDRSQRRQYQQRDQRPVRRQQEERVLDRLGIFQQQRALAEIVQHQRRQHHGEPGQADREFAEVPHIGIQRLNAGDRQHHRAKRKERDLLIFHKEVQRPFRVHRLQHFRVSDDAARAQHRQHDKPQQHHRGKQFADAAGTVFLDSEQQRQHQNG
ncbi:hypothetical protein D3C81_1090210 [compost metagenome]